MIEKRVAGLVDGWLPPGKTAAVCFSMDDIHPGRSTDAYEAGGDLERGVLGRLRWLMDRHPSFQATVFTTADWREISPIPSRKWLAGIPYVRDRVYWGPILPEGTMRLDRHPEFVRYLAEIPRVHVGLHGYYHVHKGPRLIVEFQDETVEECRAILQRCLDLFAKVGLTVSPGLCPPCWQAPPNLIKAATELGLQFLASARDLRCPIRPDAVTAMSGINGMSVLYPELIAGGRLVHITSNFAANNPVDRAMEILDLGGLLAIKAHAIKSALGHVAIDGLDEHYCNYLDLVFSRIEDRYGDQIWWTHMGEVAARVLGNRAAMERDPVASR